MRPLIKNNSRPFTHRFKGVKKLLAAVLFVALALTQVMMARTAVGEVYRGIYADSSLSQIIENVTNAQVRLFSRDEEVEESTHIGCVLTF